MSDPTANRASTGRLQALLLGVLCLGVAYWIGHTYPRMEVRLESHDALPTGNAFQWHPEPRHSGAMSVRTELPAGMHWDADEQQLDWTPDRSQAGTHQVSLEQRLGARRLLYVLTLEVVPVNGPPQLLDQPANEHRLAVPFEAPLHLADPDGDRVTCRLLDAPAGLEVTDGPDGTPTLSWPADRQRAGTFSFCLELSDGTATVRRRLGLILGADAAQAHPVPPDLVGRLTAPGVPTAFYVFDKVPAKELVSRLEAWRKQARPGAANTEEQSVTNYEFAQSMVPGIVRISAVELRMYPMSDPGWLRLDICPDRDGRPAAQVLARCWVRMEKSAPVPFGGYTVFDVPDVEVDPKAHYWLCYRGFRDGRQKHSVFAGFGDAIINFGLTRNCYPEGKLLWRWLDLPPSDRIDVNFRILATEEPVPGMHPAAPNELKTMPPVEAANAPWRR